ncbi:hypothetical protein LX32DRAFT_48594 [Colletotrichum zoysiae]|uniref:Uncharacterized protein n=1 Tax=Colletotrichum zoysiae TaxID=1216348 RepID=A0AAD9HC69_9PEZI|nr:hypothetical protein LX32DRAFT_48594 [Colletotrichum zoysiae]
MGCVSQKRHLLEGETVRQIWCKVTGRGSEERMVILAQGRAVLPSCYCTYSRKKLSLCVSFSVSVPVPLFECHRQKEARGTIRTRAKERRRGICTHRRIRSAEGGGRGGATKFKFGGFPSPNPSGKSIHQPRCFLASPFIHSINSIAVQCSSCVRAQMRGTRPRTGGLPREW